MNVGILTFWGVPNYGAFAQAYALNKIVSNKLPDCVVEHIAYLHPAHKNLYFKKKRPQPCSLRNMLSRSFLKSVILYWLRDKKIEYPAFTKDWNCITHRNFRSKRELEKYHYDLIITGSDAIWEYSITDFGDDVHLIGNNLNAGKLISYAASFGDMIVSDSFFPFISEGLKKYDFLSVRDKTGKEIIENLTDISVTEIVLDPTLLYDFKNDKEIPEAMYDDYILVYGHDFSPDIIKSAKEYAEKYSLKIIGAGLAPEWCDIRLTDIGPKEWIGMFKKAKIVITCTFHGLMFSINYEKKVVFNQVAYVKNRSTYLLEQLGLQDLYKQGVSFDRVLNYEWDYELINSRLDKLRESSMNFLEKGLLYDKC